jgi:CheY-like chemotaxis protein/HPt (histidine-containing phosphotransfer) domain-containing protein
MNDMTAWGHVLLAEDNPVSERVTRAMLEKLGFHVDAVGDGSEAVDAAALTPYRAILLDCQLPVLDGYLAASEIRRWQGASRRTPIIAVTASDPEIDEKRCRESGMDDYITKPVTLQALTDVLARWAPDGPAPNIEVDGSDEAPVGVAHPVEPVRSVLDDEIVDRLEKLGQSAGEDLLGQLSVIFLAESADRVDELRAALGAHDAEAVFRSAHTLSGSSGNLGAAHLARLCGDLAASAEIGDLSGGDMRLDSIEAELAQVRSALSLRSLAS